MKKLKQKRSEQAQFWIDFINGGIAGIISKTLTAPLERVKLILQTQAINKQIETQYEGLLDCLLRCYQEEGFFSLWRGNSVNVVRYFPTQALNFSMKEYVLRIFDIKNQKQNKTKFVIQSILAGGFAGAGTACILYPLDFARTRVGVDMGKTSDQRQFQGMIDCLQKVYKNEGIRGLYAGLNSCLFGIFLYKGLKFGFYDSGKSLILKKEYENSYFFKFLFAQTVVITSETLSYPTDTIKRRLMMQSYQIQTGPKKYKNSIDCAKKIWKEEGWRGFMKGCYSNMIRGLGTSLCLILFDEFSTITAQKD